MKVNFWMKSSWIPLFVNLYNVHLVYIFMRCSKHPNPILTNVLIFLYISKCILLHREYQIYICINNFPILMIVKRVSWKEFFLSWETLYCKTVLLHFFIKDILRFSEITCLYLILCQTFMWKWFLQLFHIDHYFLW